MTGLVTITTPPASLRLTTVANAREEVGLADASQDARLGRLIDRASGAVAAELGWTLGSRAVIETFRFGWDPGVGSTLQQVAPYGTPINLQRKPLLLTFPFANVISVVQGTDPALTAGTDYEVDSDAGLIFKLFNGVRSFWSVPVIVVQYTAGYLLPNDTAPPSGYIPPSMPADIEECALALVRSAYFAGARDPNVALDLTEGLGRVQYWDRSTTGMALDDSLRERLAPYRLRTY